MLSVLSLPASSSRILVVDVDTFAIAVSSFSGSGVGGNAPGTVSGVVGCEFKGPPPGVGGRAVYAAGVSGGVSTCAGAGISVPAVREKSTGLSVRNDLRWSRLAEAIVAEETCLCSSAGW